MFNISGQNVNFVCGLVDESIELFDVQINARCIKFVKDMHRCHILFITLFYTNFTCGLANLNGAKMSTIRGAPPPLTDPIRTARSNVASVEYTRHARLYQI